MDEYSCSGVAMGMFPAKMIADWLKNSGRNVADFKKCRIVVRYGTLDLQTGEEPKVVFDVEVPLVMSREGAVRLCWLNDMGGFDYYSFPSIRRTVTNVDKNKVTYANEGRISSAIVEKQMVICSNFLYREMFEQVAQVVTSHKVWMVESDGTFTEVIVEESKVEYQPKQKQRLELTVTRIENESFVV